MKQCLDHIINLDILFSDLLIPFLNNLSAGL